MKNVKNNNVYHNVKIYNGFSDLNFIIDKNLTCEKLHKILMQAKRFYYSDFKNNYISIPSNGVYIMYQNGETGHNGDRIVRVGTHITGTLPNRIYKHYDIKSLDVSVFRRKIFDSGISDDINKYIQENFSFAIILVDNSSERREIEKLLIKVVSSCPICKPTETWIGKNHPNCKVYKSGLWQEHHVIIDKSNKD